MKCKHLSLLALAIAAATSGIAQADVVSLTDIKALWYEGDPAANVSYLLNPSTTPQARWGTGGAAQSGYDYVVAAQPITFIVPPSPSPNKVLGTFTHQNYPINAGSSITSIKLQITADVYVDDGSGAVQVGNDLTFDYGFSHWETSNGGEPNGKCADGGNNNVGININGCADRVIANWLSSSKDFTVGLDTYTLNVIGFSLDQNGTNPFTKFWTAEGLRNDAYLIGNVALRKDVEPDPNVPEPATLALLGLGLAGLGFSRRKQ